MRKGNFFFFYFVSKREFLKIIFSHIFRKEGEMFFHTGITFFLHRILETEENCIVNIHEKRNIF